VKFQKPFSELRRREIKWPAPDRWSNPRRSQETEFNSLKRPSWASLQFFRPDELNSFSKSAPYLIQVSHQAALAPEKVRRGKIACQLYFRLDGSRLPFNCRILSHELNLGLDPA
jgi:hypothetical protein